MPGTLQATAGTCEGEQDRWLNEDVSARLQNDVLANAVTVSWCPAQAPLARRSHAPGQARFVWENPRGAG